MSRVALLWTNVELRACSGLFIYSKPTIIDWDRSWRAMQKYFQNGIHSIENIAINMWHLSNFPCKKLLEGVVSHLVESV